MSERAIATCVCGKPIDENHCLVISAEGWSCPDRVVRKEPDVCRTCDGGGRVVSDLDEMVQCPDCDSGGDT